MNLLFVLRFLKVLYMEQQEYFAELKCVCIRTPAQNNDYDCGIYSLLNGCRALAIDRLATVTPSVFRKKLKRVIEKLGDGKNDNRQNQAVSRAALQSSWKGKTLFRYRALFKVRQFTLLCL